MCVVLRGTSVRVRKPDGIPGGAARLISYDLYYELAATR
jgi:hypothetical protein